MNCLYCHQKLPTGKLTMVYFTKRGFYCLDCVGKMVMKAETAGEYYPKSSSHEARYGNLFDRPPPPGSCPGYPGPGYDERPDPGEDPPLTPLELEDPCPSCGGTFVLREGAYGDFYGCTGYPTCKTTVKADEDGNPIGGPADAATKRARQEAHREFDLLWKSGKIADRDAAYAWLRVELKMTAEECHIGLFNEATCRRVIEVSKAKKYGG